MYIILRALTLAGLLFAPVCVQSEDIGPSNPDDVEMATLNPDAFAWELFKRINAPIDSSTKVGNGPVAWEYWIGAPDVFKDPNKAPAWPLEVRRMLETEPLQLRVLSPHNGPAGFGAQDIDDRGTETRMNKEAFNYIVNPSSYQRLERDRERLKNWESEHGPISLYYIEGQEQMFQAGVPFDFPPDGMEVKAGWRKLSKEEDESDEFYEDEYEGEKFGLVGLHITSKILPQWFWATWEHKSNPWKNAVVRSVDNSSGLPEEWKSTVWGNYELKGTQVGYVSITDGKPTILENSVFETGFQRSSSCMTCHSRATIGPKPRNRSDLLPFFNGANRLNIFESVNPDRGSIGVPKREWFGDDTNPSTTAYWPMDFVWSFMRAHRRVPDVYPDDPAEFASKGDHPLLGSWAYRAFFNDSNDTRTIDENFVLGNGVMTITKIEQETGSFSGELSIDESTSDHRWSLALSGTLIETDSGWKLYWEGIGNAPENSTFPNKWHYEYVGMRPAENLQFTTPNGELGRVPVMHGVVRRTVPHVTGKIGKEIRDGQRDVNDIDWSTESYPAGQTGSWYAVKQ